MACTCTTGGAISGYCAIGRPRMEASPAMTMKMDRTAAKIGRSMKKRENMRPSLFRSGLGGGRGCGRGALRNLNRRTRADAHQPIDDDLVAGLQSFANHPALRTRQVHPLAS